MSDETEKKEGKLTSEYAVAKSAGTIGTVMAIIGSLITAASPILENNSVLHDSKLGIVAGAVIAVFGILQKTLTSLGYMKSRTEVKATEAKVGAISATVVPPKDE